MEELQVLLTKSSDALSSGNVKDAYFSYLNALDAAALELRKIKFIANVAITTVATVSLMSAARNSISSVQDILARHDAAIAAVSEHHHQPISPTFRKSSLARHSDRIHTGQVSHPNSDIITNVHYNNAFNTHNSDNTDYNGSYFGAVSISTSTSSIDRITESSLRPSLDILEQQGSKDEPSSPSNRLSPFSSPGTSSPVIYSPLLRSASVAIPAKPTRRPPPSPYSDSSFVDTLDTNRYPRGNINSPTQSSHSPETPPEQNHHPMIDSPPQIKPPLPPKPTRYRKVSELRSTDELSMDEDSSEEDEDESEAQQEGPPLSYTIHRKTSSPNIAIPKPWRRPGPSVSVPASPSHSPPNIPSSCPSSQYTTRSFSHTHYSLLRQNSSGLVAVIPEGCVDPSNLVEAERINGDDEDEFEQKTYGPADHLPMIPVSPLRTTHRSLVEKEKSWSSMMEDTKHKIQELCIRYQQYDESSEENDRRRSEDEQEIQSLQEDAGKYTSQVSNIMATITKVRELLYRSAGITSVLEFPPYLLAYQLTLVESAIFLEIPHVALLTHSPKTPHKSITASTDFFNYLTRMIEYSVLFPPEASARAQIINHWIKVAVKLHELENFQTLKAILCALGTPPIKRLKRTWSFLPRKSTAKMETLSEMMSEDRNYGKYREMLNSLFAGTALASPEVASPVFSDTSSSVSGSRFDILGSWSSSDIKTKEPVRRPVIPFLGTFIMDMTYLLAAVKKTSVQSTVPSSTVFAKVPPTSSLREKNLTVNTAFTPQDDVRIQDLLNALTAYQSGPRYSPQPPRSYIKAATKSQNHFRAPSLSSALQMTTKYRGLNAAAERERQFVFDDEDDDLLGGTGAGSGGIRSMQQLILHYLLTRPWAPERMVDELSMIREPSKNQNSSSNGGNGGGGGGSFIYNGGSIGSLKSASIHAIESSGWSGGTAGSVSGWSGMASGPATGSSVYSQSSSISLELHTGTGSSEGSSRPTSMEDE
ncbi:hypothetical protein BGZ98_001784 [Dissophora globulifera]|nr:hypothetical protein BGZ98_001784 [Dissophora globulifera]